MAMLVDLVELTVLVVVLQVALLVQAEVRAVQEMF
jgi:hypothetical protein